MAFDKVCHRKLITKLKHYGIQNKILTWIEDFLKNRHQKVVVRGKESPSAEVTSGVPQGSVLGPLVFLVYINDITKVVSSEISLFADDALLYKPIKSLQDVRESYEGESVDNQHRRINGLKRRIVYKNYNTKRANLNTSQNAHPR